ncbi:hypothetical protein [Janthinobacterium kumbetense]|uniref:Uncharacterized protein n=1 Tax=Janthinobacterium kumbetense TaxID=2950280 RepID=A0ABT0WV53_9BURK|nr:hypothetical protein [Janthinobacterium kumbetense]MCM2567808.1 hypothetical protein [Janthinobacterium kumbetense]
MENTLHAASQADNSPAPTTPRPALQKCVVPMAPTCFLLHADAGASVAELSAYIREIAKTYHAYGAANLTFIISDAQALQLGGFFTSENQRALVGNLPLEMRYLFASEEGTTALSYWGEGMTKVGAR